MLLPHGVWVTEAKYLCACVFVADLVAIPDFAAGAMENWGLITYRMIALLYDSKVSTTQDKQWVAVVIAHEIAHQVGCVCSFDNKLNDNKITSLAPINFEIFYSVAQ